MSAQLDGEQDNADSEQSLSSVEEQHIDQTRWASGTSHDLEKDDGESGIADQDGQQVVTQDWRQGAQG